MVTSKRRSTGRRRSSGGRATSRRPNIDQVPTESIFNTEASELANPRKRAPESLKTFLYGSRKKNFDVPVATFDRMR